MSNVFSRNAVVGNVGHAVECISALLSDVCEEKVSEFNNKPVIEKPVGLETTEKIKNLAEALEIVYKIAKDLDA